MLTFQNSPDRIFTAILEESEIPDLMVPSIFWGPLSCEYPDLTLEE